VFSSTYIFNPFKESSIISADMFDELSGTYCTQNIFIQSRGRELLYKTSINKVIDLPKIN